MSEPAQILETVNRSVSPTKRRRGSAELSSSPNPNSTGNTHGQLRDDRLGALVNALCTDFATSASWEAFVNRFRGPSYLSPELDNIDHPAAALLRTWRDEGVPAKCHTEAWTREQKDECIKRGCHYSANEHSSFIREEMAEFIENKFWMVLPYELVSDIPQLMLSPAAIKEERERKPRFLCDHSWQWGWGSVNDSTIPHAPHEAMQFGWALERLLCKIRHADPKFGPVRISKADIKDGFYRLFLNPSDCLRLSIVLPQYEGEPQLVGIPLACTMGWVQSPPTFCTMSETVCDISNAMINQSPASAPPHRMEKAASVEDDLSYSRTPVQCRPDHNDYEEMPKEDRQQLLHDMAPPSNTPLKMPLATTDVFVDDFLQLGQGGAQKMKATRRHLYHAIDKVLATPEVSDDQRLEALSLKKLKKGDGAWSTRKELLGWVVDTLKQTLELPAHRKHELRTIFNELNGKRRVSQKQWQRLVGKLRFVSTAISGSTGLFSALQTALNKASSSRVRITKTLADHLAVFNKLVKDLQTRPTHLAEIVPQAPSYVGTTDAAKQGMGGVFFAPDQQAYIWRYPFSPEIQRRLVSADNPNGSITNSDLEQAGMVSHLDIIATTLPTTYCTITTGGDNTPAVSRMNKGATSLTGAAPRLCLLNSSLQREHRYCHIARYLAGDNNVMADDASRLQHLTDSSLLDHFNAQCPQPRPWKLVHLRPAMASTIGTALLSELPMEHALHRLTATTPKPSIIGQAGARQTSCPALSTRSPSTPGSKCSSPMPPDTVSTGDGNPCNPSPPRSLSELLPFLEPSPPWPRASPSWASRIPESTQTLDSLIAFSTSSAKACTDPMSHLPVPTPSVSASSTPCTTISTSPTSRKVPSTLTSTTSPLSASSS